MGHDTSQSIIFASGSGSRLYSVTQTMASRCLWGWFYNADRGLFRANDHQGLGIPNFFQSFFDKALHLNPTDQDHP
jgi:hypothetical protein